MSPTDGDDASEAASAASVRLIAVTREQAACMLSMSLSHFQRHVQAELPVLYVGRLRLVRVADLEAWAEQRAALAGAPSAR